MKRNRRTIRPFRFRGRPNRRTRNIVKLYNKHGAGAFSAPIYHITIHGPLLMPRFWETMEPFASMRP